MLRSLAAMGNDGSREMRCVRLTAAMLVHQQAGDPIHHWPVLEKKESDDWSESHRTVGQFMSTDLFTVRPDDLVDLAASVMDWRHVRHVPVEDDEGRLIGLISHRSLLRLLAERGVTAGGAWHVSVREIMKLDPVTATPATPTLEAIKLMREHHVGCLPVVEHERLVGIVTSYDFLTISAKLFEERLAPQEKSSTDTLSG